MSNAFRTLFFVIATSVAHLAAALPPPSVLGDHPVLEHDDHGEAPIINQGTASESCIEGVSSGYPCHNVEMLSRVTLEEFGAQSGSDSWGWKDPDTGRYYALMGLDNGVSFVDITDPENPQIVGHLPSTGGASSAWRDVKTYKDHAFIVADSIPGHGMQVFDLKRLRKAAPRETFEPDARYDYFGPAHNIAINEESGFAYAVGTNRCQGGLNIIDIREPKAPLNSGCFSRDGYTHDVFCRTYSGPDDRYEGSEICFASNEESLTIIDVTDKTRLRQLGKTAYTDVGYTHQGWLSEDQRYFLLGDELDEVNTGSNARTLVFDVSNLREPAQSGQYFGANTVIDHNLYVKGQFIYQANYASGLRILLVEDMHTAEFGEVAYFDTAPAGDQRGFTGAWNAYPFFDNGLVIVSDMQAGLFVLRPDLPLQENAPLNGRMSGAFSNPELPDQGVLMVVGENLQGPFVFLTWFLYLDGEPFWLSGAAPFEYGASSVDIPMQRTSGLDFLQPDVDAVAAREDIGTIELHVHDCTAVHVYYDFGEELGSGDYHMMRLAGVEGRGCHPGQ